MIVMHIVILWSLRSQINRGYGDFTVFYTAGKLLQQGRAVQLYDRSAQSEIQKQFAYTPGLRAGPLLWIRPPFYSLLFLPFAYLSFGTAYIVWTLIKMALLFATPALLIYRRVPVFPLPTWIVGFLGLGLFPIAADLLQGQDSIVLLFVLTLVFRLIISGNGFLAGCALALGLFKFHLVVPILLVFLFRRKWNFVAGFFLVAFGLFLISVMLVGRAVIFSYPRYVWNVDGTAGLGVTWFVMPNLRAILAAARCKHIAWLVVPVEIFGAGFTAWLWHRMAGEDARPASLGFSLAIVMTIVTSYYAYSYDTALLLIPMWLLGGSLCSEHHSPRWTRAVFMIASLLFILSPLHWLLLTRTELYYVLGVSIELLMTISLIGTMLGRKKTDHFITITPSMGSSGGIR